MKNLHGIIFSYERQNALKELTATRSPASVPFAGRYRMVDFVLSSMVNAGVCDVGVILNGDYRSLLNHLGSGKDWDLSHKHGSLRLLPPFSYNHSGYQPDFRGKMDALYSVRSYLQEIRQSHVVLADSDLVANIPLREVFQEHLSSGADITAVCTGRVGTSTEDATFFRLDEEGRITDTMINLHNGHGLYRSLDVFILSKELLLQLVDECASADQYSFCRSVLQGRAGQLRLNSYLWDGYAVQIHSLQEYYDDSMALLDSTVRREIFHPARPVHTKERNESSTYIDPDGVCVNSLVADGCTIEGTVENSILFRGVTVARGAKVKDCILMQGTTVARDAVLQCVITDKNVQVQTGRTLIGCQEYPMAIAKNTRF